MTIYQSACLAGLQMDCHESDLYLRATPEAQRLVKECGAAATTFTSATDCQQWLDVPFAYDPFWEKRKANAS